MLRKGEAFVLRTSSQRDENIFSPFTNNQFIASYKYPQFMLQLNSNNQIVLLYYYDNKKQITIVLSSCHLNATVNHLRSTSTYTSYFVLLFFVTKYYKSAVYVGGDSVKSDQTCIGGGCMFQGVRKKEGKNKRHRQKYRKERRTFCYERRQRQSLTCCAFLLARSLYLFGRTWRIRKKNHKN